ncbi:tyrosine-type recombinase/integrase [Occultella kanbiaonis]|uniref:tyrosine-type recombinase/integrase n=1 Tax=Occultella kanbiaonis TaxID=2675754 RepID=UPI0012B7A9A8|nr:tyrosine-type recombinase/integrase [Occultella kanbiaonis]
MDGTLTSLGVYDTLGDAKAALAIARGEEVRGIFTPPSVRKAERRAEAEQIERESLTFAAWSEQWLTELEANPKRSGATVVSYRSVLANHVLPVLGDTRLVDLTAENVSELLVELRSQPSKRHPGATVNGIAPNVAIVLRSCLNAAVKRKAGGLSTFTFPEAPKHLRVRPEDPTGEEVATPAEVERIAVAMPERLRIAVPLAAWCALRIGEVLGLQRRDLEHLDDPARATLHVRRQFNVKAGRLTPPKADSARSIAIPAFLLADLREHLDTYAGTGPESSVLANTRQQRVSQTALDNAWRAARDKVRPGFRFHNLRHTGLTIYAQQGATLAELLHRGGHTDVSTALRYQHATAERDRALTARLADVLGRMSS